LAPQASFFTQVMNQGILGHYVAPQVSLPASTKPLITSPPSLPNIPRSLSTFARI
jgi:hypothetical protein